MPAKWFVEFVAECVEVECIKLCLTHSACVMLNCRPQTKTEYAHIHSHPLTQEEQNRSLSSSGFTKYQR